MTTYTNIFTGGTITPSENNFSSLSITSTDINLSWKYTTGCVLTTKIMDISSSTSGRSIILDSASEVSTGETILFNNIGQNNIEVKDSTLNTVGVVTAGTTCQVYLANDSTWRAFTYGAGIALTNPSLIAGSGLQASGPGVRIYATTLEKSSDYTASLADRCKYIVWSGTGAGVFTLPDPYDEGLGFYVYIHNSGDSAITVNTTNSRLIGTSTTLTLAVSQSVLLVCDGLKYNIFSLTSSTSAVSSMTPTSISIAGTGDYTLPSDKYDKVTYTFIGTLTGDRTVILPSTVQEYWVFNNTTGAYKVYLKMTGTEKIPLELAQGQRGMFFCDGVNIQYADTRSAAVVVAVASGGTGATTGSAALTNLGGGSTGIAVLESSTVQDAFTALGWAPSTGDILVGTSTGSLVTLTKGSIGQSLLPGANTLSWGNYSTKTTKTDNYTVVLADANAVLNFSLSANKEVTLPAISTLFDGFTITLRNDPAGSTSHYYLNVIATTPNIVDGSTGLTFYLQSGESVTLYASGTTWRTIGNNTHNILSAKVGGVVGAANRPTVSGSYGIALGVSATASGAISIALGTGAIASGSNTVAVGYNAVSSNTSTVAVGQSATANSQYAVAVGLSAVASASYSVAVGYISAASGLRATALGYNSAASGTDAIALGPGSAASGTDATALGASSAASGDYTTALGYSSVASGDHTMALGYGSVASGTTATALGSVALASGVQSTTIGYNSVASGAQSTALGTIASATGVQSTAIGRSASASGLNSVALGATSHAALTSQVALLTKIPCDENETFSNTGGGNYYLMYLGAVTTSATPVELAATLTGVDGTNTLIIPNNSTAIFSGQAIARHAGTPGDTAAYTFTGAVKRVANAASTLLLATVTPTAIFEWNAGLNLTVTADTTYGGISIKGVGLVGETIYWSCALQCSEFTSA